MTLHASFGCNSGNFVRCRVLRTLRRSDIFLGREQNFFHTQRLRTSRTHEFSGVSTYSTYEPVPVRSVRNAHPRLQREKKANCKSLYWYVVRTKILVDSRSLHPASCSTTSLGGDNFRTSSLTIERILLIHLGSTFFADLHTIHLFQFRIPSGFLVIFFLLARRFYCYPLRLFPRA